MITQNTYVYTQASNLDPYRSSAHLDFVAALKRLMLNVLRLHHENFVEYVNFLQHFALGLELHVPRRCRGFPRGVVCPWLRLFAAIPASGSPPVMGLIGRVRLWNEAKMAHLEGSPFPC